MNIMGKQDKNRDVMLLNSNQTRELQKQLSGSKFLVIVRKNSEETLSNVSPFIIKKTIDYVCDGEVELCKKLRNGSVLVKTKSEKQTIQLMSLNNISPNICVEVTEHNSLNSVKGVFYTNSIRGMSESVILEELKAQQVTYVKKILKNNNNQLTETGLYIITFKTTNLPDHISLGYEKVKVRPYIPYPLRCFNCFRFGHPSKYCRSVRLCDNCCNPAHINTEKNEICSNNKSCINCNKANNFENPHHSPLEKNCPTFLKEREIQTIKTLNKISREEAIQIYNNIRSKSLSTRSEMSYDDMELFAPQENLTQSLTDISIEIDNINSATNVNKPLNPAVNVLTSKSQTNNKSTIKVLPSNTSNRTRRQLKAKLRRNKMMNNVK